MPEVNRRIFLLILMIKKVPIFFPTITVSDCCQTKIDLKALLRNLVNDNVHNKFDLLAF